ncbi:MAG: CotH kinase family protein [Saprospiraceae bacterium]
MKNFLPLLFILFLLPLTSSAQDLYDLTVVQTIEITFAESNWDQLLDAQKAGAEDYTMAQTVAINGEVYDSVGVKYKGNSTYNANQAKNPFHIELDTYKEQEHQGYSDIKLSNVANDPSFVREVLSYEILRNYMDAPLSNYANVYVNGNLIGLYSNSEAINKDFVKDRFGSKNNTFIKCNPIEGAGPGSTDLPNLVYLGTDSVEYYPAYELKSDYGWADLLNFCDTLANETASIEQLLDVDRALWMLAFNNVLVNLDSYIGGFAQNYYLYQDDAGRFLPVVWDLNESFGKFSMTGSGNLRSTADKQQMSALLQLNDADYPLISKLLNNATYQRMYIAHCKTMLNESFADGSYLTTGQTLQTLIDADVQADGNKFFTYANFTTNLTSDITSGGGPGGGSSVPGITNLMDGRVSYLLAQSQFTATAPSIGAVTASASGVLGQSLFLTSNVSDANTVTLAYRTDDEAPFEKLTMLDDGQNGDGAAGDGVYGIAFTPTASITEYYVYAENNEAGAFLPTRAAHIFSTLLATQTSTTVGDVVINEFLASNDAGQTDEDGEFEDWIELYNNTNASIDLAGYSLSDDGDDLQQWSFEAGTSIAAGGYLVIWADKDSSATELHANFKLSAGGESIFLSDASGTIIDEVVFADQTADVSYGRFPNGTGDFQTMSPTFGAMNSRVSSTSTAFAKTQVTVFPNPVRDVLTIELEEALTANTTLRVFNGLGQVVQEQQLAIGDTRTTMSVYSLTTGMYVIQLGDGTSIRFVKD